MQLNKSKVSKRQDTCAWHQVRWQIFLDTRKTFDPGGCRCRCGTRDRFPTRPSALRETRGICIVLLWRKWCREWVVQGKPRLPYDSSEGPSQIRNRNTLSETVVTHCQLLQLA